MWRRTWAGATGFNTDVLDREVCMFITVTTSVCTIIWMVVLSHRLYCRLFRLDPYSQRQSTYQNKKEDRLAFVSSVLCSTSIPLVDEDDNKGRIPIDDDESTSLLCAICLDTYRSGDEICSSPNISCRHYFHKACAEAWLLNHDECPCCRSCYVRALPTIKLKPEPSSNESSIFCHGNYSTRVSTMNSGDMEYQYVEPLAPGTAVAVEQPRRRVFRRQEPSSSAQEISLGNEEIPPWIMFFATF